MTTFAPIAIVGRACLLPGASSPDHLWRAVVEGRDLVSRVPSDRWGVAPDEILCDGPADSTDRTWSDRGGYVEGFDELFDPTGFAVDAGFVRSLDPVFQWTLHTAREALRDAGYEHADAARFAAIFGNLSFPSASMAAYTEAATIDAIPGFGTGALERAGIEIPDAHNRFNSGFPAIVLEDALSLGAGALALDAACASSLYAIKLACDRLHDRDADLVLAGAVNCADDLCIHLGFSALTALSRTGQSRPFHAEADGLVPAEGCGFVALRRLEDAVADGDTIHGVIRGVGLSNDGRGRGMLVPSSDGQTRAMANAVDLAGIEATSISLLECHATGTQVGDATEISSAAAVYGACDELAIGSLKSNTGHLITAAGVAGLIKVIEAMRHETRPPTLHAEIPLDVIAGSPFRLLTEAEPWSRAATSDGVLRAGVSAFGFGGNNAHLIVEEPAGAAALVAAIPPEPAPAADEPIAVVAIGVSAARAVGLDAFTAAIMNNSPCLDADGLGTMPPIVLDIASQKFPPNDLRKALPQQLAMVQVTDEALAQCSMLPKATTGVFVGMGTDPEAARFGIRWRLASRGPAWGASPSWIAEARDAVGPALDAPAVMGTMPNIVANRLNSQYDLSGPSFTISAEEHSGVEALRVAARALCEGEVDAALVGAVDLSCDPVHRRAAAACLAADRQTPGDAAVMLVCKRLSDAQRDGDTIYATLPSTRVDQAVAPSPDLTIGLDADAVGSSAVNDLFGHAHAASSLVHVAAAAVMLHRRSSFGDVPLLASNDESGTGLPAGAGPRMIKVTSDAIRTGSTRDVLLAEAAGHHASSQLPTPALHIFSGSGPDELLEALASGRESDVGPARLVIVADSQDQLDARADRAKQHLTTGSPPGVGVRYAPHPMEGELGFVFTAAGAAYPGMGAQLLRSLPELADAVSSTFPVGETARWMFEDPSETPSPSDFLWGTSLLTSCHTHLTRHILGLRPTAAIGYSSGESNSLYAFDVWQDRAAMHREIQASGMMDSELGVAFAAVARAWGTDHADWAMWNVLAPVAEVEAAIEGEPRLHLAIINTGNDVVIGGDKDACERVIELVGRRRCRPVAYNLACHVPEVAAAFHTQWIDIHTRVVTPAPGVRHYSNGSNSAYEVSSDACAAVITQQAEQTLDFPATIEAAYADGVRIFVEHGPAGACTNFIGEILGDREHLAIQLDRRHHNIEQVFEVAAALVAAGVPVDHAALSERLTASSRRTAPASGPTLSFASHADPATLPSLPTPTHRTASPILTAAPAESTAATQTMAPAPTLPTTATSVISPAAAAAAPLALSTNGTTQRALDPQNDVAAAIHAQVVALAAMHHGFVEQQASVHQQFLHGRAAGLGAFSLADRAVETTEQLVTPVAPRISPPAVQPIVVAPQPAAPAPIPDPEPEPEAASAIVDPNRIVFAPTGPVWDKTQLEIHSSGTISELYGPLFQPQDHRAIQCRMPEPPLLLADRVTGLEAEPGVLGRGKIWTETDVVDDAWYLNDGYMPTGFMIESGQADLMLISYMGIDLITDPDRSYRLLGCTLTYHGDLPSPGETLQYEIRVTGHAKHGDIRLFFFEYDCIVDGVRRLTVRDGQAGFFNAAELDDALGILWTPESAAAELDPAARVDPPAIPIDKSSFTRDEVIAFSEGRVVDCFGPAFAWTETHTRTPKIQSGKQLFIDEVTDFDPTGGPWGRGFLRCKTDIADDAWFFDGHFKNDPCMPGNFMVEACIEAMSFYLAALGFTTRSDGWRFQPLPEQPFELKCRGEINPSTEQVVYEVHVEEIWAGPHPTIICDVVGFVDGSPAFHAHRIGVELTPDWPLTSMPERYRGMDEPVPVATDAEGFPFDWKAMISCAWGKPSEAFGSMYSMFDGTRRSPRLPGEPYHFISRVLEIDGDLDVCQPGMRMVCEYDIPDDAWYFDENGAETMPYAVLLEAALQPCGWVASAIGSATAATDDMLFRNLDGTGTLTDELTRTAGTLTTHVVLKSVSRAGGMIIEGFEVECSLGDRLVYTMDTVFGFFPPEAFEDQAGLAIPAEHRAPMALEAGPMVDLTTRPERYCSGSARLAAPMLLMLDRAAHIPGAGRAELGVVRGEKDVDVSEWFFKAHFFQDPVQPGSLGIEALLQLLQFFMLDNEMAAGLENAYFEPIMLGAPMTWKYRGQVTPKNAMISSVMEITEVGADDAGPFVIGTGSLWCDGIRIYEVKNMGMRLVSGTPKGATQAELSLPVVRSQVQSYWQHHRNTPTGWLGDDLIDGMFEKYVNRVATEQADTLDAIRGRSVIYLANHQVQIESLLVSNLLPAITGVPMTTVANAKHRRRWIGRMIESLETYPGTTPVDQIAYFDQSDPASMLDLIAGVKAKMADDTHSFFVHSDGTRARSCRDTTQRCSSVFLDLALELGVPIVPIRFSGGLPVDPIVGKAEVPVGHGKQDYWIGHPIEAETLAGLPLRQRVDRVVDAINSLGGPNSDEAPLPGDTKFAAAVETRQRETGVRDIYAASWEILSQRADPGPDLLKLRSPSPSSEDEAASSPRDAWLTSVRRLLTKPSHDPIVISAATHPHLLDHAVDGTPVVPVVFAIEWFARAIAAPGAEVFLRDLQVLKGIVAPELLGDASVELAVEGSAYDDAPLRIIDRDGRPRYRATVGADTGSTDRPSPPPEPVPIIDVYGGVLFHGPRFQVLSDVATSPVGMVASVAGVLDRSWPGESWISDPAALDGALQLCLLWTEQLLGEPSLPTAIEEIVIRSGPTNATLTATLVPRSSTATKVVCDVVLRHDGGTVAAELRGVTTHCLPRQSRP